MKNYFKIIILLIIISLAVDLSAQVTIGMDKEPQTGALLDLRTQDVGTNVTADKGLGLPRVALTELTELYPMFLSSDADYIANKATYKAQHAGLTVYNITETAPFATSGKGIYTWDGSQWGKVEAFGVKVSAAGNTTTGSGMTPPTYNDGRNLPNCYIVAPNNTAGFTIPIQKAFLFWKNYRAPANALYPFNNGVNPDLTTVTGTATASILWSDVTDLISSITISNGKTESGTITITTANKTGNAVIDFKIGTTTYWSWHIWVTAYNPATTNYTLTNTTPENKYVFMDRNLGATTNTVKTLTTFGLLYQWGRKDPFPGSGNLSAGSELTIYTGGSTASNTAISSKIVACTTNNNLANAISNPMVFYTVGISGTSDWYTNVNSTTTNGDRSAIQNDQLWDENGGKTPFDPCPQGWRVPPMKNNISPWFYANANGITDPVGFGAGASGTGTSSEFTDDGGWQFKTKSDYTIGYYPAAGFRVNSAGTFYNVGNYGCIWSASAHPGSASGSYLSLGSGTVSIQASTLRANGFSVRCVKE